VVNSLVLYVCDHPVFNPDISEENAESSAIYFYLWLIISKELNYVEPIRKQEKDSAD
jgi:hypothetical protein